MKLVKQQREFTKKDGTKFKVWLFYIQLENGFLIRIEPRKWSFTDKNGVVRYDSNEKELLVLAEVLA